MTEKLKHLFVVLMLMCSAVAAFSQTADDLPGKWKNAQATRVAEFYKDGDHYTGKLVSVSGSEEKGKAGDIIFKDLKWDGSKFTGLTVTPRQGDVPCTIMFDGDKKVVKISITRGVMSGTVYWSRVE